MFSDKRNKLFNLLCTSIATKERLGTYITKAVVRPRALPYIQQRVKIRCSRMLQEYKTGTPGCSPASEFLYKEMNLSLVLRSFTIEGLPTARKSD
jgi:hypothetical protein